MLTRARPLSYSPRFAKGEVKIETRVDAFGGKDVTKTAAG